MVLKRLHVEDGKITRLEYPGAITSGGAEVSIDRTFCLTLNIQYPSGIYFSRNSPNKEAFFMSLFSSKAKIDGSIPKAIFPWQNPPIPLPFPADNYVPMSQPPSTNIVCPVIDLEASEARNKAAAATSPLSAKRFSGVRSIEGFSFSSPPGSVQ